jgi:hypothetical protein
VCFELWGRTQTIYVETTKPNYGGVRLWWTCPDCGRRCGKLYMPGRPWRFACRLCHELTYESAQVAGGLWPRVWRQDARRFGVSTRTFREAHRSALGAERATVAAHTGVLVVVPPDEDLTDEGQPRPGVRLLVALPR